MTIAQTDSEIDLSSQLNHGDSMQQSMTPMLQQFDKILHSYSMFNVIFLTVGFIEIILLLTFFTVLTQSAILALSLAIVFLTFFTYFILRLYYQAQKPEQLKELKEHYMLSCQNALEFKNSSERNVAIANACSRLSDALAGREYILYQAPQWLNSLRPSLERFSCWCHWYDVHYMRELLLKGAVDENIKLVKLEPTSLEAHAALANAYTMLSILHTDPLAQESSESGRWMPKEAFSPLLEKKFRLTAERAIEEFKIISDFAPDDPWVHAQLAYSYHDLKMPLEEIKEYEILLKLDPEAMDIQFKLGALYFEQGMNAKGLRIYEELKATDMRKAEELIKLYGVYSGSKSGGER